MKENKIGRFISYILRHNPSAINISLDKNGWARVADLIYGVNKVTPFDKVMLDKIVREDSKQRYTYNEDQTLIRANQGHSIDVDVELEEVVPPDVLYHGTATKYLEPIKKIGLIPMTRLYVHISKDINTAINVGKRHGQPIILKINAKKMYEDGHKFYLSKNHVYLTKFVPPEFLELIDN